MREKKNLRCQIFLRVKARSRILNFSALRNQIEDADNKVIIMLACIHGAKDRQICFFGMAYPRRERELQIICAKCIVLDSSINNFFQEGGFSEQVLGHTKPETKELS